MDRFQMCCMESDYTMDPPYLYSKLYLVYEGGLFKAEFWKYYDDEEKKEPYEVFSIPQLLQEKNLKSLFDQMKWIDPYFMKSDISPQGFTFETFKEKVRKSVMWFHKAVCCRHYVSYLKEKLRNGMYFAVNKSSWSENLGFYDRFYFVDIPTGQFITKGQVMSKIASPDFLKELLSFAEKENKLIKLPSF